MDEVPFKAFTAGLRTHVDDMVDGADRLYLTAIDKDKLWELYLSSFPAGTNPVFRERTEHDCSACRHFIKTFGGVVALKNGVLTTIWDFEAPGRYGPVVEALAAYVRSEPICDIFVPDAAKIGTEKNHEMLENDEVVAWEHFYVELPARLVPISRGTKDQIRGEARAMKDVFKRSLEEISVGAVETVLKLIASNSLYRGVEWRRSLVTLGDRIKAYGEALDKNDYAWEMSGKVGPSVAKIKNHSIGVLLTDISKGMDLDEAVRRYEAIVAPSNYKRPKAIFTERMVKDAEKTITDLGYLPSLGRRHARIEDITVNNILFVDRDAAPKIGGGSVFDGLAKSIPKKFDRLEEVPLQAFLDDVLPTVQKVEMLLENRHAPNLVSLVAPQDAEAPSMFKWGNGFSWAYRGNMADSMKERVKAAGGNVEGVLRFSLQWNDEGDNHDDLDAHCIEPGGNEIFFPNKTHVHRSSGVLDVDIIDPVRDSRAVDGVAVENISWSDLKRMPKGVYRLFVHCYNHRGGRSGFSAEVEFDGQIYSFAYNQPLRQDEKVQVAEVSYDRKTGFKIKELIPSSLASRNLWGLDTGQFHRVSVVMHSPNYWDGQDGIGNRHVFFMIDGCLNPETPNGFFNEYLKNELLEHKRVFEALGGKMRVADSDEQLSGVGLSTTQRNEITVRVTGNVTRILKIKI